MREIWKPVVLVIVAFVLAGYGVTRDPSHPTCEGVILAPGAICETEVKGTPQQRTYSEVVTQTRAWQVGAPIAGGVIALAGATWIVLLLRRSRLPQSAAPEPPVDRQAAPPPHPEPEVPEMDVPRADRGSKDPPRREQPEDSDPTRSPWAPRTDRP